MRHFPVAALPLLACPHCGEPLAEIAPGSTGRDVGGDVRGHVGRDVGGDVRVDVGRDAGGDVGGMIGGIVGCAAGHRFDVARQGYLALLGAGSRTDTADSAAMVAAREEFLSAGHFGPIAAAVAVAAHSGGRGAAPGPMVEVGAGTGYYLAAAGQGSIGVAVDSSRYAARRAATRPGIASVLADAWAELPVRDAAASVVLSVFAPRRAAELHRITAPGGRIVIVTPEPAHLAELRGPLRMLHVDAGKADRIEEAFAGLAEPLARHAVVVPMMLSRSDVEAIVGMGPAARHRTVDETAAAVELLPTRVRATASVTVTVLVRPRG